MWSEIHVYILNYWSAQTGKARQLMPPICRASAHGLSPRWRVTHTTIFIGASFNSASVCLLVR